MSYSPFPSREAEEAKAKLAAAPGISSVEWSATRPGYLLVIVAPISATVIRWQDVDEFLGLSS